MQTRAFVSAMLLLSSLALSSQAIAQQKVSPIVGTYLLIQDDDGTAPRADAQVTIHDDLGNDEWFLFGHRCRISGEIVCRSAVLPQYAHFGQSRQ